MRPPCGPELPPSVWCSFSENSLRHYLLQLRYAPTLASSSYRAMHGIVLVSSYALLYLLQVRSTPRRPLSLPCALLTHNHKICMNHVIIGDVSANVCFPWVIYICRYSIKHGKYLWGDLSRKVIWGSIFKAKARVAIVEEMLDPNYQSDPWIFHYISRPFGGYKKIIMQDQIQVLNI